MHAENFVNSIKVIFFLLTIKMKLLKKKNFETKNCSVNTLLYIGSETFAEFCVTYFTQSSE